MGALMVIFSLQPKQKAKSKGRRRSFLLLLRLLSWSLCCLVFELAGTVAGLAVLGGKVWDGIRRPVCVCFPPALMSAASRFDTVVQPQAPPSPSAGVRLGATKEGQTDASWWERSVHLLLSLVVCPEGKLNEGLRQLIRAGVKAVEEGVFFFTSR